MIVPAVVIVAVVATAATYAVAHATPGARAAAAAQGTALAGQPAGTGPLRVLSVSPAPGASGVDGANPVVVTFSAPLADGSPMPSLRPAVRGSWRQDGASLVFSPAVPFGPSSHVALRIPAGAGGVRTAAGTTLGTPFVAGFRTMAWSARRLSQLLAELRYLPLSWSQRGDAGLPGRASLPAGTEPADSGIRAQMAAAYSPPAGTFRWHHGYPASLHSQWRHGHSRPGLPNVILKGAVMAFESQHGMTINGVAGAGLWEALFRAADRSSDDVRAADRSAAAGSAAAGSGSELGSGGNPAANRDGYTYALASKGDPETLTIWHDGHVVLRSSANTGIPVAPTADGTFPVYLRYRFQIMRGVNPDGSSYADPVSYVSYFHGGDAVHYFPRGSYGYPQSLGCVELPLAAAEQAWPYLTYGSLVTVTG